MSLQQVSFPFHLWYVEVWPKTFDDVGTSMFVHEGYMPKRQCSHRYWSLTLTACFFFFFCISFGYKNDQEKLSLEYNLKACQRGYDQFALVYSLSKHSHSPQSSDWVVFWAKLFIRVYLEVNFFHFRHTVLWTFAAAYFKFHIIVKLQNQWH